MALESVHLDLAELLGQVEDVLTPKLREKGLAFRSVVGTDLPQGVRGDPTRLRQVLLNLAGNAIKFTPHGEVAIEARVEGTAPNAVTVRFSVIDTGIGIPPEKIARLFDAFTQADSSTTREFGGTGLGLSISKGLVEQMGGRIGVDSVPGRGSTFWFTAVLGRTGD